MQIEQKYSATTAEIRRNTVQIQCNYSANTVQIRSVLQAYCRIANRRRSRKAGGPAGHIIPGPVLPVQESPLTFNDLSPLPSTCIYTFCPFRCDIGVLPWGLLTGWLCEIWNQVSSPIFARLCFPKLFNDNAESVSTWLEVLKINMVWKKHTYKPKLYIFICQTHNFI